mgnify:FL=1
MPNINLTNRIIEIHLSSWRYFAALSLPPIMLAFACLPIGEVAALCILFLVAHYYCWRLWLDERLFQLLNEESNLAEFDQGMAYLWGTASGKTRSMSERWHGVRRLFYRAILALLALWVVSLCLVLYVSYRLG